jgi:hypothetical protein
VPVSNIFHLLTDPVPVPATVRRRAKLLQAQEISLAIFLKN